MGFSFGLSDNRLPQTLPIKLAPHNKSISCLTTTYQKKSKVSSNINMPSTPPPIPFHSRPTRSTATPEVDYPHSCSICKDVRRFPYQPDRCPFTGGDISYKLGHQHLKRRFEEDDEDESFDAPVRVETRIYCTFPNAINISRWLLTCIDEDCLGYDEGKVGNRGDA